MFSVCRVCHSGAVIDAWLWNSCLMCSQGAPHQDPTFMAGLTEHCSYFFVSDELLNLTIHNYNTMLQATGVFFFFSFRTFAVDLPIPSTLVCSKRLPLRTCPGIYLISRLQHKNNQLDIYLRQLQPRFTLDTTALSSVDIRYSAYSLLLPRINK